MDEGLRFLAVGDTFLDCAQPDQAFGPALDLLARADLLFGNSEGVYSRSTERLATAGLSIHAAPGHAAALQAARFHVLSVANNHAMDLGGSGLAENAEVLGTLGIQTVGAGADRAAAHRACIVQAKGRRVGFLARTSVFPPGFPARPKAPGVAALRVHSHYYISEHDPYGYIEPGVRPSVRTVPYPEDLDELKAAVEQLRASVDVLVCSFHWGLAGEKGLLTDYERIVGRAVIDWGADLVLGHHQHYLRGIEIHRGKPIYYGLGHFAFSNDGLLDNVTEAQFALIKERFGAYAIYPREGWPTLPFHPDGRLTFVACCDIGPAGTIQPAFLPCLINPAGQPVPVSPGSAQGGQVIDYLREVTQLARLQTRYDIAPHPVFGEVVVASAAG